MFSLLYHCQDFCQSCLFIWITRGCFITSRNWLPFASTWVRHRFLGRVFLLSLCCRIMCLMFCIPCCDVGNDFRIKTMFGSSLRPVVCRRDHVLFTLFVFVCMWWCPTRAVLCLCFVFFVLCTLCCQFIWIARLWFPLRCSLTFIFYILVSYTVNQFHNGNFVCLRIENKYFLCPSYIDKSWLHLNGQMWWHIHSC